MTDRQYTPDTEDVRENYELAAIDLCDGRCRKRGHADEFDRWLAAHDAEVAAKALEEAGHAFTHSGKIGGGALFARREVQAVLRKRSAEIRKAAEQ